VKINTVRNASDTLLLVECHQADNIIGWSGHACINRPSDQFPAGYTLPHNGKCNWAFVDGHVSAMTQKETVGYGIGITASSSDYKNGKGPGGMWTRNPDD
jgi:prepilin-type processing-associated H-X9-DG protein